MSAGDLDPDLEPIERASRDELAHVQLERMRRSLAHAYERVPHYRAAFDASGVRPDDLRALADLAKFPFTTKQDLRANYPFGMFAVSMDDVVRIHASSGTTGKPTVVGYTRGDLDVWAEVMARSLRASGVRKSDLVHNALGYGLFTGGLGFHCGAEPWTNEMRREIEAYFDLDAFECYGLSEVIGPGVAMECAQTKDGCHVWEDHFYPEIIDPVTGRVLPDGELGELVFTSLTKEALPVVRYRTRDLTRLLPGTARPAMRRMAKIAGRSDDMLIIRGVNVFPGQIEELILKAPGLSAHYLLEVSRPRHLDELAVRVEVKPEFAQAGDAAWGGGEPRATHQVLRRRHDASGTRRTRGGRALGGESEARDRHPAEGVMSEAFLIFAIVLNSGIAVLVFWWVFRELRRNTRNNQRQKD
jgi:phenylacetate-CoA ligase